MILKAAACAAILCGCGYFGIVMSDCSKKRTLQLGEFRYALKQLEFDVDFLCIPIHESFDKIACSSSGAVKSVFLYITKRLRENPCVDIAECWSNAFEMYSKDLYVNDDDKRILADFVKNLGSGNREKEINNIKAADIRLKIAEEDAHEKSKKDSKMYRGLGFLCGIFLVIILV